MESATEPLQTEALSCGFCLQKLAEMEDPRRLPCDHVSCLPCLEGGVEKLNNVKCAVCGQDHGNLKLSVLHRVVCAKNPEGGAKEEQTGNIIGEICTGEPKAKDEMIFTEEKGNMEPLDLPQKRENCSEHINRELRLVCRNCTTIFCEDCSMDSACTKLEGSRGAHVIKSINMLAAEYRSKLELLMENTSDKISAFAKTEKQNWKLLDEVEKSVEQMKTELQEVTEKQIAAIKTESDKMQTVIDQHLTLCTEQIVTSVAGSMEQREELGTLWRQLKNAKTDAADELLIKGFEHTVDSTKFPLNQYPRRCEVRTLKLKALKESCAGDMKIPVKLIQMSDLPSELSSYPNNHGRVGETYSISWTNDGSLVSCGKWYVALLGHNLQMLHRQRVDHADCVRQFNDGFLMMLYRASRTHLQHMTEQLEPSKSILPNMRQQSFCQFCLTNSAVVVVNCTENSIDVYDRLTLRERNSIGTDLETLRGIHALDDNSVVVTDHNSHVVRLYNINTGEPMWTYTGARHPTGVSSDLEGFIYVADNVSKQICVLSSKGKEVARLTNPQLKSSYLIYDISVSGTTMAVACGKAGVIVFNIER